MKKYKIRFNLVNLFFQTQKEVVRVQTMVKTFTGAIAATTWYTTKPEYALYIAGVGFIIDAFLACLWLEEVQ